MATRILAQELFSQVVRSVVPERCFELVNSRYTRAPNMYHYSFHYFRQGHPDPGLGRLAKELQAALVRAGFKCSSLKRSAFNTELFTAEATFRRHEWMNQPSQSSGFGIKGPHPARMNLAMEKTGRGQYEITYTKLTAADRARARPHLYEGDKAWREKRFDDHYAHAAAAVRALGLKSPAYVFGPDALPRSEPRPLAVKRPKKG